jgi:DNA-directed RNA polymerase sigma subunit (sigma70/sigma32)
MFKIGYAPLMTLDRNRVADLLRTLSPTQEKVVRLYFGLGCQRPHSATEIAQEFHVSAQVISGILSGAERKLRQAGLTPSELRQAASIIVISDQRTRRCRHTFRFRDSSE